MWFDKVKFLNGALWWPMSAKPTAIITTNLQTLGGNNYVSVLLIIVSLRFTCGKKNNWWNINKFQNDHGIWHKSGTVIFKRESFWHLLEGTDFYPKKNFLILTQQNIQFCKQKIWSDFSWKKTKFSKRKNLLFLSEKVIPHTCVKILMRFISEVFWTSLHYFLCYQTRTNHWER